MAFLQRELSDYNKFVISFTGKDPSLLNRRNRIAFQTERQGEQITLHYNIYLIPSHLCKSTSDPSGVLHLAGWVKTTGCKSDSSIQRTEEEKNVFSPFCQSVPLHKLKTLFLFSLCTWQSVTQL